MNIFSILGFIIALAVLIIGLAISSDDFTMFVDYPSLFIVLGGTFATTSICFQLNRLFGLFKIFLYRMLKGKKFNYSDIVKEVMILSDEYRKGASIKSLVEKSSDYFFQEALTLLDDGIVGKEEALEMLYERNENLIYNYMNEANKIKTVGKFPPAWGMIGTTIGMIVLLSNLGGEDAMKKIGPAMSVALITTLYGTIFSNAVFIPIAENLIDGSKEIYLKNKIIIEGVKLLMEKQNPIVVAEKLNSFLIPGDRLDWKEVLGK
jgi:chemotaxis protein MotA